MDENTSNTNQTSTTQSTTIMASQDGSTAVKIASPADGTEHRQAYGTAKTENLRDSGAWRFVLPAFVVLLCLALLAIPLLILGPLLYGSLAPQQHVQLTWVWIVMILLEVGKIGRAHV